MTFLQAIARMEGFGADPSNRPTRNHNPGDLEYGEFTRSWGAMYGDPRFAVFATDNDGWNALEALFKTGEYFPLTIAQAINRFAPPTENQTTDYIDLICRWTGLTPETYIEDALNAIGE